VLGCTFPLDLVCQDVVGLYMGSLLLFYLAGKEIITHESACLYYLIVAQ
jgi:hypothetical protein